MGRGAEQSVRSHMNRLYHFHQARLGANVSARGGGAAAMIPQSSFDPRLYLFIRQSIRESLKENKLDSQSLSFDIEMPAGAVHTEQWSPQMGSCANRGNGRSEMSALDWDHVASRLDGTSLGTVRTRRSCCPRC